MNSTFTSNKAVQSGGGVFQNDCASSISFSIFSKNDGGSGGGGGALPGPHCILSILAAKRLY